MTFKEVMKLLRKDGWREDPSRTDGSHYHLKHPTKKGTITVPRHGGDIAKGTLNSILKQAGLK